MSLPTDPIPAPGFQTISGKRKPPANDQRYEVQFRNGYVDRKHSYTAAQIRWLHKDPPDDFDVVAVRKV